MLGLLDQRDRKIESLRDIISSGKGDYVDDAMYELGRTYVQTERFNDGAAVLKRLTATYPESPYYLPALSQLFLSSLVSGLVGAIVLNFIDKFIARKLKEESDGEITDKK